MLKRSLLIASIVALALPLFASAAASNSCLVIPRSLSRGAKGLDVTVLQQYLVSQKLLAEDTPTGYYGALTEAAVQKWQIAHGPVSKGTPATTGFGSVGAKTRALLCTVTSAQGTLPSTLPSPVSQSSVTPPAPVVAPVTAGAPVPQIAPASVALDGVGTAPSIASFLATPDLINAPGEQVKLSWTAFTAAACDIGYGGVVIAAAQNPVGVYAVTPNEPTVYTLTCKGFGDGSTSTPKMATSTRPVTVLNLAPGCSISLDKPSYFLGDPIRLSWKSTDTDSASWMHNPSDAIPMPYGNADTSGQYFLTANSVGAETIQLNVAGKGGASSCTATITTVAKS